MELARRKLLALTELVKPWHENEAEWGFNEWTQAQTGRPGGRDWQTWSAAMYLYAAECVQQQRTPFFDEIRAVDPGARSSRTLRSPGLDRVAPNMRVFGRNRKIRLAL